MKNYEIEINGETYQVKVKELSADADMTKDQTEKEVQPKENTRPASPTTSGTEVKAPMAGSIVNIQVSTGEEIAEGDVLGILEAMKMENEIIAPTDGLVKEILVDPDDNVESDQILFVL
ncbi:MAG: acetyl-CoA carboxylase biotin carboxyl carrier protein subunit [Atopostipes sp.]|nr:acetyl-CoA carboxylase biotin carboxyl carrier protein subunit [Atopostipes sp.]